MYCVTFTATLGVLIEGWWRFTNCKPDFENSVGSFQPTLCFVSVYVLCMASIFLNLNKSAFVASARFKNLMTLLYACDGVMSLFLGLGMYYKNNLHCIGFYCLPFSLQIFFSPFDFADGDWEEISNNWRLGMANDKSVFASLRKLYFPCRAEHSFDYDLLAIRIDERACHYCMQRWFIACRNIDTSFEFIRFWFCFLRQDRF